MIGNDIKGLYTQTTTMEASIGTPSSDIEINSSTMWGAISEIKELVDSKNSSPLSLPWEEIDKYIQAKMKTTIDKQARNINIKFQDTDHKIALVDEKADAVSIKRGNSEQKWGEKKKGKKEKKRKEKKGKKEERKVLQFF